MKVLFLLSILTIVSFSSAASASWYCEAECGTVYTTDLGGSFSYYLAPFYRGGYVNGEGETITAAFRDMKNQCSLILHSGFVVNNPGAYIKLNTSFRPSEVCERQ